MKTQLLVTKEGKTCLMKHCLRWMCLLGACVWSDASAVDAPAYDDGFELPAIDSFWTKTNQNSTTTLQSSVVHGGGQAVRFSASGGGQKETHLTHDFTQLQYGKASVWVRDSMEYIYFSIGCSNTTNGDSFGIGVQDWDTSAYYSIAGKTSYARSVGWHLFTIEASAGSLRALIDGQVVYSGAGGRRFNKVRLSMTGPGGGTIYFDDFHFESWLPPEIEVELPATTPIASGATWNAGTVIAGEPQQANVVIRNTGEGHLLNLNASVEDATGTTFSLALSAGSSIPPGSQQTFLLSTAPTTSGSKAAVLRIASNDADENPFVIHLQATALSTLDDSDSDGMNDAGEHKLAALGFDRTVPQSALVQAYFSAANTNGLFTTSQVHAIHAGAPILSRDPISGVFTLTLGLQRSTNLQNFDPMPMSGSQVNVNGEGKVQLQFNGSGNAAFYRIGAE